MVLDPPMMAQSPAIVLGTRLLTADEIPEFQRRLPLNRALAVTHANGGQTGPIFLVTNPLGGRQDGITAKLLTTVTPLAFLIDVVLQACEVRVEGLLEPAPNVFPQMLLVLLDDQGIIAPLVHDLAGD